jgi:putative transposase
MADASDFRTGRHCVFVLHVHLVFVTKYRRHVFNAEHLTAMRELFRRICADFEAELVEFDGEDDHVHLLANYPPKVALSALVNSLKGVSSRILRKRYPGLAKRYRKGVLWSPSYFASSCGGAPLDIIKRYIESQRTPS